jgi:hypothetical protein
MTNRVAEAVERGDLDALVRLVDGLASAREWDRIVELRDRCRHALERGLQLWPAAEYAEYRLALEAPPAFAGPVVTETQAACPRSGWGGPTTTGRRWRPICLGPGPRLVAHERVLRGDDLWVTPPRSGSPKSAVLEPWEPSIRW